MNKLGIGILPPLGAGIGYLSGGWPDGVITGAVIGLAAQFILVLVFVVGVIALALWADK